MNETDRQIKVGTKYKHFKGNEYRVLHIAKDSETLEELVVYQAQYEGGEIWVRPLAMFLDRKELGGQWIYRFTEVED